VKVTIGTPAEMEALGAAIAPRLRAGDLIELDGELGRARRRSRAGSGGRSACGVR
jgi:tRNA A37 threonylcarbamoyladenosine biosynthesis protein TsaE